VIPRQPTLQNAKNKSSETILDCLDASRHTTTAACLISQRNEARTATALPHCETPSHGVAYVVSNLRVHPPIGYRARTESLERFV
jgi:hypothetical protein